ncbi:hypothetical protein VFPFJ_10594 [Purpureocillium lilacinum]|uniref:Uncharacterized protein n=1 Tax=Purpureocillium lilacinum TaxID=33203 RepID=A0A179GG61_PURLI|nr:hypothetical protein VFPFJ_10594 [Purpureocillium lilacinum]OAQ76812.1 hypothetical protein VFPFJ_10594 [Purpureocillium lilacinum]
MPVLDLGVLDPLDDVLKTVGFIGTILGIVNFGMANVPKRPNRGATVRIKVGTSGKQDAQLDGGINSVYAWDSDNLYLGATDGDYIDSGDVADYVIDSISGGTRAEYVAVSAARNAICIAWITVAMFDGTTGGAWTGDVGHYCGQSWYPQHEKAGWLDDKKTKPYIPKCTWIDRDHSNKIKGAALKFSVSGYGDDVVKTVKNAKVCKLSIFGADSGPISKRPAKRETPRERLPWMENTLVVSNITQHTAEEVCSSATSWGPDFIGSDGKFCDMGAKVLSPLCSTENVAGCIDINSEKKTATKRSFIGKRSVDTPHRTYEDINNWQ